MNLQTLFDDIISIFYDTETVTEISIENINLLEHYKNELGEVYFDEIYAITRYKNIETLIEEYKFYGNFFLSEDIAQYFIKSLEMLWYTHKDYALVPTPMHFSRILYRGFDHIKTLSKVLSRKTHLKSLPILKSKYTHRQVSLGKLARIQNRTWKYYVSHTKRIDTSVILIDDIVTTGSTMNECAKVLKAQWCPYIVVLCLATNL